MTSGATASGSTVSCTLTVGSNTDDPRRAVVATDGTTGDTSTTSIPLQLAGPAGTVGRRLRRTRSRGTGTADPAVSVDLGASTPIPTAQQHAPVREASRARPSRGGRSAAARVAASVRGS